MQNKKQQQQKIIIKGWWKQKFSSPGKDSAINWINEPDQVPREGIFLSG